MPDPKRAEVAQSVEQRTENPRVGGSIPSLGTKWISARRLRTAFFIGTFEDREIPYFSKIASLALETVRAAR